MSETPTGIRVAVRVVSNDPPDKQHFAIPVCGFQKPLLDQVVEDLRKHKLLPENGYVEVEQMILPDGGEGLLSVSFPRGGPARRFAPLPAGIAG